MRHFRQFMTFACCAVLLTGVGCKEEQKAPLNVPAIEHTKPVAPVKRLGRLVKAVDPTIANALAGKTRSALKVHVSGARLGPRYAWLKVTDDSGSAWAVTPPLSATPTGQVELKIWVRQQVDLPHEATKALVLWTARIAGDDVKPLEMGEEAVIDPVFAAMEITGTVVRSDPPEFPAADHTIAALHMDKSRLEGSEVSVRGQVLHVIPDLSGRTWWVLRDGRADPATGEADPFASGGPQVLLVAASSPVDVGDIVLVRGTLQVDKAFTLTGPIELMLMPATRQKDALPTLIAPTAANAKPAPTGTAAIATKPLKGADAGSLPAPSAPAEGDDSPEGADDPEGESPNPDEGP
ncbi:MAG: hypothetical protein KC502_05335 [Myxococcales bacterium]|nr:hypothetical protein [Myxococcales bacterium]